MIFTDGLLVGAEMTSEGRIVYAEIVPATSLLRGRSWKQPHIRWWFEIHEKGKPDENGVTGVHWYQNDGGAVTFRSCVNRALDQIQKVVDKIEEE